MPEYLSEVSPRDKPWDTHKEASDNVARLYFQAYFDRYGERMTVCARRLSFVHVVDDDGKKKLKLRAARFCRVRLCPICQWRRTQMWTARFYGSLPKLLEDHPKARFLFLTLTVRNCPLPKLRETIKDMNAAWHRMIKKKFFPAVGFMKTIEVTKGRDRKAHPHIHVLLMVKPSYFKKTYIKQAEWTEQWRKALRVDYTPSVDIRVVKDLRSRNGTAPESIMDAVREVMKYSVKPQDLMDSPEWLAGMTTALHNTRGVSLGGLFKNYLSQDEPEDLINTDTETNEKNLLLDEDPLVFDWINFVRKYAKRE